ncbi:ABC transporter ATP-binding protein [Clostridium sp. SHJSY1]|uniref:ABC transporter ATP-binding protein n=1 Tax=Clostridium sp. SHJSY1 TaxID=2942483 RepID=UPI00287650A3|nr:ABC transporter ATP-binding protein [Clostridium sp. SHJSY1]MDS0525808.1 ABC transporter ATP-binding protein [Clostridium sp. SHJSY1]
MGKLLEVNNISYGYKSSSTIIKDISFSIEEGEIFTILGPNGAGKSTLLNCIAGLFQTNNGQILLEGKDIIKIPSKIKAQKVAYVPQTSINSYGYSVRDYIAMGRAPHLGMFLMPAKSDYKIVDEAIDMLEINHYYNKSYSNISGGQRQLANIARAIVQQPKLIIFDEPTSALDYGNQLKIMRIVKQLSENGYSIIMTTHNPNHPILLGGHVGILNTDGNMEIGLVTEIIKEDILSEVYKTKLRLIYMSEIDRMVCVSENL